MENRDENDSDSVGYLEDMPLEELYSNMYNIMTLLSIMNLAQIDMLSSREEDDEEYEEVQTESLLNSTLNRNENIEYDGKCCLYDGESIECVICKGDISDGENVVIVSQCKHTFHFDCLNEWIKWKSVCPLCYNEIPKKTKKMD